MTLPPPDVAAEVPVDQLGLIVLKDMLESNTWNERNYVLEAQATPWISRPPVTRAREAIGKLKARGLLRAIGISTPTAR